MALHAALFSSLFRFRSWCFGASHGFVGGGIVLFNSCGNSASADVCGEFSFSFSFLSRLFFSAALTLRYCNAVCLMRFRLEP